MAIDKENLTEEQKQALEIIKDQQAKIGEVFSQCWESEEFKQAFIADPKAIFEEYGVNYSKNKEYKVIDTPEKTVIHVLPYEGIKAGLDDLHTRLYDRVKDLGDEEGATIIPEGWTYQMIQNTEDTVYFPIPVSPEDLTPEELELVNGGCLILVFVVAVEAIAEVTTAVTAVYAVAALAVVVGALFFVELAESVAVLTTAAVISQALLATVGVGNDFAKKNQ